MEYQALGGLRASRLGFGCAPLGGYDYGRVDDELSVRAIHHAIEQGVTLFDTADVYGLGHAERVLGRALASSRAHDVVVATKAGVRWDEQGRTRRDLSPRYLRTALEESLRRLKRDHIDLYQLHWPDPETPIDESLEVLLDLRAAGKVHEIGLCNFPVALAAQAIRLAPIVSNQHPCSLLHRDAGESIMELDRQSGVPTLAYSVLAHGLLSGNTSPDRTYDATDLRRRSALFHPEASPDVQRVLECVRAIARRLGRTPSQVSTRWVLQQAGIAVVLVGFKSAEQVSDLLGAMDWTLETDDLARLTAVAGSGTPLTSAK